MHAVKLFVAGLVGLVGMTVAGPPAHAGADPDPDQVKKVTKAVRVVKQMKSTPIEGGYSHYCAVGVFLSFDDVPGYLPQTVHVTYFGNDSSEPIGTKPYDDKAAINGLVFPPVNAAHQTQIGDFSYMQGGGEIDDFSAECDAMQKRVDDFFAGTGYIEYTHTAKCKAAIRTLNKAAAKVKATKKKLDNAHGADVAPARKKWQQAKADHAKAKVAYRKVCT